MPADITCTDFDMERAGLSRVCTAGMATIDTDLAVKAAACFASANATFSLSLIHISEPTRPY